MRWSEIAALIGMMSGAAWAGPSVRGPMDRPLVFHLDGVQGWDVLGSAENEMLASPGNLWSMVSTIAWDLRLTTFGGSPASDARVMFSTGGVDQLYFTPAVGIDVPVIDGVFRSEGEISLWDLGLEFFVADSPLRLEFFEAFDDLPGQADAVWHGTIWINMPSPGVVGTMGAAALVGVRRRR